MKQFLVKYKTYLITLCALVLYVLLAFLFKIPCPIKYLTGISCAGCGMSRALISAVTLNFAEAFAYHPLWVTVLPAAIAFAILGANGKKRASMILLVSLAVLFFATWIIRIAANDEIVKTDLANSAIARLFEKQ